MLLKKANLHLFKGLTVGKNSICGVNNAGRKTLYHRGSGVKRNFRILDFKKYITNVPAIVITVEYDPNRTAPISLLAYSNGALSYTLAVSGTLVGSVISTVTKKTTSILQNSDSSFLNILKPGVYINSIEINIKRGATYARSGGVFAKLVSLVKDDFAIIKLKSRTLINVNSKNMATLGVLSSPFREFYHSAGTRRRLGRRPHVRGVAMNPIDHPHGGGQGKTSGGRPSVTPWALTTKGRKTKRKINYAKTEVKG